MKLILASGSEWRGKLLSWLEVDFGVRESGFDEKSVVIDDPEELVTTLALEKAMRVAREVGEGLVIGADTVIVIDDKSMGDLRILGKPDDIDHAREILKSLRGRQHQVFTGLAVVDAMTDEKLVEVDITTVIFKDFSNEALENYLATGDSLGKAGAYQFLKIWETFVDEYEGSVTGVIGLPLKRLVAMLEEMGVEVGVDSESVVMKKIGVRD